MRPVRINNDHVQVAFVAIETVTAAEGVDTRTKIAPNDVQRSFAVSRASQGHQFAVGLRPQLQGQATIGVPFAPWRVGGVVVKIG